MEKIKNEIIEQFRKYLLWETAFSYDGWENIEVHIGNTLSGAWLEGRPEDAYKFQDIRFKKMVNSARGKWLEKQSVNDTYKVIISTERCHDLNDMVRTYVHELRHCLDYQNAVRDLRFEEYELGNKFYLDWSEYRASMADTRYEFYQLLNENKEISDNTVFYILSGMLGRRSADAVAGLMNNKENIRNIRYYISRYVGSSRAIRNLNMEFGEISEVFHLWNMMPVYIDELYNMTFYLGNEWDELEICKLNQAPSTHYYEEFLKTISTTQQG